MGNELSGCLSKFKIVYKLINYIFINIFHKTQNFYLLLTIQYFEPIAYKNSLKHSQGLKRWEK